jgi:hypothetical protein
LSVFFFQKKVAKVDSKKVKIKQQKQTTRSRSSDLVLILHLIVFLVSFFSAESGFFQLIFKSVHTFFISEWTIFKYFTSTEWERKRERRFTILIFHWLWFCVWSGESCYYRLSNSSSFSARPLVCSKSVKSYKLPNGP